MKARKTALLLVLFFLPLLAFATIQPGEKRTVTGSLEKLDAGARTVVVSVPLEKGRYKVGVYVPPAAPVLLGGKPAELGSLPAGNRARLSYTREGDRLIAEKLEVFPEKM